MIDQTENLSGDGCGPQPGANDDLLAVLKLIAERAGKTILGYYAEAEAIAVREKADSSPVTEADEAAEEIILEFLASMTPEVPVVSEERFEAGEVPDVSGGRFWLVDPLDGTKEFLNRNGEFTVNIALIEGGRPIAGVVHAPAMAMTWAGALGSDEAPARALFSQTDQSAMDIRVRPAPAEGLTVVASRRHGSGEALERYLGETRIKERVSAGSSVKFCLVASGRADLYPRFGRTMEWDTAAGHAVLAAAGGRVETAEGAPLTYAKPGFENPHFIAKGNL